MEVLNINFVNDFYSFNKNSIIIYFSTRIFQNN